MLGTSTMKVTTTTTIKFGRCVRFLASSSYAPHIRTFKLYYKTGWICWIICCYGHVLPSGVDVPNKNNAGGTTQGQQPRRQQRQQPVTVIAILQQMGRTTNGMKVLRTRIKDICDHDKMGNGLDVAIRHLLSLAWHWGNHQGLHGAVLWLDDQDNDETMRSTPLQQQEHECDLCQRKGPNWWMQ
jgi:hypothetical protein